MDKRRSVLNVSFSIGSRFLLLIVAFVVRRLLIHKIGNDVNGLNSLYASVLGVLAVVELGIGNAIIYSMYQPIVEDDRCRIAALYDLYKRLYRAIGIVIFCAGLISMPFLPYLIEDYGNLKINVYCTFFLILVSVVLSYFYSAKTALIEANKDNYITTGINTISQLIRYGLQVLILLFWPSFELYLICQIVGNLMIWRLTNLVVRKKYRDIISRKELVSIADKTEIVRNVKAMLMHRIGSVMVNSTDSIIISTFVGVVALGKYSNYSYVAGAMTGIIALFFTPLTSVIGHLSVAEDKERTKQYFDFFYYLNYILGVVFFLGYYLVIDDVVTLAFGTGLEVARGISYIITLSQFVTYMRYAALVFRNASGAFYYDRFKPVVEGVLNVILSIAFVVMLPREYNIVGVIAATILTTLVICDTVEPYVIYKYIFRQSAREFYIRNYLYIGLFAIVLFVVNYLKSDYGNCFQNILINGMVAVVVSLILLSVVALFDRGFRVEIVKMMKRIVGYVSDLHA